MRVAAPLVALVAALVLLATGCGRSEESDASATVEWADGVCAATVQWTDSLKAIGRRFTDLSNLSQDRLEEAVNDARQATLDFVSTVEELEPPDTESGREAKQALDNLARALETGIGEVQDTVEGIQGITGVPAAIASIGGTLTTLSQEVSSTIETLTSGDLGDDLKRAFEQAPACAELTSTSS